MLLKQELSLFSSQYIEVYFHYTQSTKATRLKISKIKNNEF